MDGEISSPARRIVSIANMNQSLQKCPGCQNYLLAVKEFANLSFNSFYLSVFNDQSFNATLPQSQSRAVFQTRFMRMRYSALSA